MTLQVWIGNLTIMAGALVLAGCIRGDDPSYLAVVRDSAGVAIVDNASAAPGRIGWRIDPLATLEVGRADGVGPDVFGFIPHVSRLRNGQILVADAINLEIRAFDEEGNHVLTFGGRGDGPGEFSTLRWVVELAGDSIAAVDNLNARVSVFGGDGRFSRSFEVPRLAGGLAPNVLGLMRGGPLVVSTLASTFGDGTMSRSTVLIYTVDLDGRLAEQLGAYPDRQLGSNGLPLGFGGSAELSVGDSVIWYGHSDRFELHAFDRAGSLVRILRMNRAPRLVTPEEVAEARDVVEESLRSQGAQGPTARRILETDFAATHPVHGRILVDLGGSIWVAQGRTPSPGADQLVQEPEDWDVFSPDGRLLGQIATPAGFRPTQIGEDFLLGVHTDEVGVHRVRLYRLERT